MPILSLKNTVFEFFRNIHFESQNTILNLKNTSLRNTHFESQNTHFESQKYNV